LIVLIPPSKVTVVREWTAKFSHTLWETDSKLGAEDGLAPAGEALGAEDGLATAGEALGAEDGLAELGELGMVLALGVVLGVALEMGGAKSASTASRIPKTLSSASFSRIR
jgi:hypothetical protein